MIDNRSLEKKLLALSHGEEVEFTEEEKRQICSHDEMDCEELAMAEKDKSKTSPFNAF